MSTAQKFGLLTIFVAFLNLFLFRQIGTSGLVLFYLAFSGFMWSVLFQKSHPKKITRSALIVTGSIMAVLLIMLLRANGFVQALLSHTAFGLVGVLVYILRSEHGFARSLSEFFTLPFQLIPVYFSGGLKFLDSLFSKKEHATTPHVPQFARSLIIGVLAAIPIIFVLIVLLSGADPIYGSFIKNVFKFTLPERLLPRIIFTVVSFGLLAPFLFLPMIKSTAANFQFLGTGNKSYRNEMSVILVLVGIVLASFLIIQWPYVFVTVAQETDLSKFGVATYSEYVKKGFGEFILISLIIYVVSWIGLLIYRSEEKTKRGFLLALQCIVLAEFGIFLLSIFRRVWLYQAYHGWSLVRIYGALFVLFIAAITLILLLRHFIKKQWHIAEIATLGLFILGVGLFDAETFIVNNHPPTVNHRVDYVYMSRMSADGYVGWQEAFTFAQNTLHTGLTKSFLNKDDRREIFYSGFIVERMLKKRELLTNKYASNVDWIAFKKNLLTAYEAEHNELIATLEATVSAYRQSAPVIDQKTTPEIELDKALARRTQISDAQQKLTVERLLKREKLPTIEIHPHSPYYGLNECTLLDRVRTFELDNVHYKYSACAPVYRMLQYESETYRRLNAFDKIFVWNAREAQIYRQLEADMPLETLIQLERQYRELRLRMLAQPPEERGVDTDISFDTPFLESLF